MDKDTLIEALRLCASTIENAYPGVCMKCPYCKYDDCGSHMAQDVLELLVEPKPRLITEADFHSANADDGGAIPCWKEPRIPQRRSGWTAVVYGKWLEDSITWGAARYWTSRPTKEQMEATPWPPIPR